VKTKPVDHAEAASKFIQATHHVEFHDKRLWDLRQKRDRESEDIAEWEQLRALRTAKMSEIAGPAFSKPLDLLKTVRGIRFVSPQRPDECCGFGGTFSVFEEPVSARMGYDKVTDHHNAGAEYIVSADMSCVMHQKGCAERLGLPIKFIHIAQILNGAKE
jgi:Fe-S oxidoreductase